MNLVSRDESCARYGQLVLPNIVNNYGPMYVAKLKRLS